MSHQLSWSFDRLYNLDSSKVKQTYPSGASYGVFRWPNGACYDGEFVGNKRHGEGKQEWSDGSSYVGKFQNDVREGYGRHTWFNGEMYEGTFLRDKRHGNGTYLWPDGTRYKGHFYNDLKDGYGCFHFSDGKQFEGMYKNDERNGPGVLSHCDGMQDIGIWSGEKLVRLCTVMENAFVFQHFSDYFVNAGENVPSKVKRANSVLAVSRSINEVGGNMNKGLESIETKDDQQVPETFPLTDILLGVRNSSHGRKGPCELASEEFLHVSGKGDCMRVMELLDEGLVHVDVADKTGFTALLAASVNCHKDIINCLLDYGADVNKLNYEGLSPLAACHVLFYTKHTWNDNIGETLARENLFNSVHWDTQSGRFVQRKPIYYQNNTHSKFNLNENSSISSINAVTESNRDNLADGVPQKTGKKPTEKNRSGFGEPTIAFKTDVNQTKTDSALVYQKTEHSCKDDIEKNDFTTSKIECSVPYGHHQSQELQLKCAGIERNPNKIDKNGKIINNAMNTTGEDILNNEENLTASCDNNYRANQFTAPLHEEMETATRHEYPEVSKQRSGIKESVVQRSEMVDKNTFIQVFLHRAASARSKQNSSISFENINSIYAESYNDNRDEFYQNEDSRDLVKDNSSKDCDVRESDSQVLVTVTAPEIQESIQYSMQNAISSSLQTTNTVEDTDSLKNVQHGKQKLLTQQRRPHLEATVQLLLRRGANPNASSLPMPVLFFAIKAADAPAVKLLLEKGADTNARLSKEKLGITPLHIAVALPHDAVSISKLLLEAGADPNLRDFAFGDAVEAGRTSLHTACCREDDDEDANHVIRLLLDYKADPNLLCNGHSALSLVIASGNDLGVETLLKGKADPSLSLSHGVGSPLCAAVSFTAEKRRKVIELIRLVNKLIRCGANILAPIIVSDEHSPGTVVDYAYSVFHQDRRIAHTPYHALTPYEREIYNARRKMLDHLAELLRTHVLKKEKKLLEEQLSRAKEFNEESCEKINEENLDRAVNFYFDETRNEESVSELGSLEKASIYDESHETLSCFSLSDSRFPDCGLRVAVVQTPSDHMNISGLPMNSTKKRQHIRKNRFRYCYECGRSVAVRLAACTRCKEVFYCSRSCKLKAWNSRHREECIRLSARNKRSYSGRTENQGSVANVEKNISLISNSKDSIITRQNSRNSSKSSKELGTKNLSDAYPEGAEIVH